MAVTCAEANVLINYHQLLSEGFHSWWWQFFYAGAAAIWTLFYSFVYYLQMNADSVSTYMLYFGFMLWASLAMFLMLGFVGLLSSFWFIKTIFSIAKAGEDIQPLISADDGGIEYIAMEMSSSQEQTEEEAEGKQVIQVIYTLVVVVYVNVFVWYC